MVVSLVNLLGVGPLHIPLIVVVVVITALVMDFTCGFHECSDAVATSVATGAFRPLVAVGVAAVGNLIGALLSTKIALTISNGIVDDTKITPTVIFAGLVAVIIWNLVTWVVGLPSSTTHALYGGLIGATVVAVGMGGVHFAKVASTFLIPAIAAPVIAGIVTLIGTRISYRMTRGASDRVATRAYRAGQMVSASMMSLAHGSNDGQKTMGVITLALVTSHLLPHNSHPPLWVILSAAVGIGAGTFFGGWRIIRTVGKRLTDLRSPQGFVAESASTAVVLASGHLGLALSTTHVSGGAVIGSGLGRRGAAVRWSVAGRLLLTWLVTVPAAAIVAGIAVPVASAGAVGTGVVAAITVAVGIVTYLLSRRNPVNSGNVNDVPAVQPAGTQETAPA
ncbi:phosphate transporter [Amycolatopsis taiwanensis]|uniref:Phosphate transporter n=1 Tax=Amycolatopsis taiwanensis TaxID=342230 RepID=A0A9W6QXH8_9PSEU|nr:phosphate transporter [Amycolatopsis taiwanensis]